MQTLEQQDVFSDVVLQPLGQLKAVGQVVLAQGSSGLHSMQTLSQQDVFSDVVLQPVEHVKADGQVTFAQGSEGGVGS